MRIEELKDEINEYVESGELDPKDFVISEVTDECFLVRIKRDNISVLKTGIGIADNFGTARRIRRYIDEDNDHVLEILSDWR